MKKIIPVAFVVTLFSIQVSAQQAVPTNQTPPTAHAKMSNRLAKVAKEKAAWDAMTPEQKAVAKEKAKTERTKIKATQPL